MVESQPSNNPAPGLSPLRGTFVGRDREMRGLKAALEDSLSGQGRLVMLVGEPGIGKTRTSQELASYAEPPWACKCCGAGATRKRVRHPTGPGAGVRNRPGLGRR